MPVAHYMKVDYRPSSSAVGGWLVLADESVAELAARISGYQPVGGKSPMVIHGYSTDGVVVLDMGNWQWTLNFSVEREHADAGASRNFISTHAADIGLLGNLDLRITTDGVVTYMPDCVLTGFKPNPASDKSSFVNYTFIGGSYYSDAIE